MDKTSWTYCRTSISRGIYFAMRVKWLRRNGVGNKLSPQKINMYPCYYVDSFIFEEKKCSNIKKFSKSTSHQPGKILIFFSTMQKPD